MNRRSLLITALAITTTYTSASGPIQYETPFIEHVNIEDVITGEFPERLKPTNFFYAQIMYLQLSGRFTVDHAVLYRSIKNIANREEISDYEESFWNLVGVLGFSKPKDFSPWKLVSAESDDSATTNELGRSRDYFYIHNCKPDAFKTAYETLMDREILYGRSVKLTRWLEAQIEVFSQCNGEYPFKPLQKPTGDWSQEEKYDREYQIAAQLFYAGEYIEAASHFTRIGQTEESPWHEISQYLVGRSYLREAIVNGNEWTQHLNLSLRTFQALEENHSYRVNFPSVTGQIRRIRSLLDPFKIQQEIETRIFENPSTVTVQDLRDYSYLKYRTRGSNEPASTDYEHWLWFATNSPSNFAEPMNRWVKHGALPWLYLAMVNASEGMDESSLVKLLEAAEGIPAGSPGYFNILVHRIRILGLLDLGDEAIRIAEKALVEDINQSQTNRIRLATAKITSDWRDFVSWSAVTPIALPWTDESVRELPINYSRITTDTSLFDGHATYLINTYFTASMIEETLDALALSDYQRGRMAMAGWTKALLAEDMNLAMRLGTHIRKYVPWLEQEIAQFELASDKWFEAARIIFEYPAFSPWLQSGAGRVHLDRGFRQIPDHVTYGSSWPSWWCEQGYFDPDYEKRFQNPRFKHYTESEFDAIRSIVDLHTTAATTAFGPYVLNYARQHLDDPRVPRALHRLVFATRHACWNNVPGKISQAAFALLHDHFPDSEWASKTPYWYGRLD